MRIELLYVDDCPSVPLARDRIAESLRRLEVREVVISEVRVPDDDAAHRLGFLGSPSVRVDGVDLLATGGEAVGLSCRRYPTPEGPAGCPTQEQLDGALSARVVAPAPQDQTTP